MGNIKKVDKVSFYQVVLLIMVYRLMTGLTYLPLVNVSPSNQDMWIVSLLSIFYTIIFCWPLLYLANKFNNLNLLAYSEKIMGKFLGKIIGIFYSVFLFLGIFLLVSILVEILDSVLFPETPTYVTASIMLITCIYISYKGFRNIARLGEMVIPFILIMIFLAIILGYRNYDFRELLPIFKDSTFKEINIGAINIGLRFSDIIILAMITPHLEKKEDLNKIFFRSLIYSIGIVTLMLVVVQTTFGIEFARHINFPLFTLTRLLELGRTIQGFDSVYIISWIMGNVIKISGYLYFTTVALEQITSRKNQGFIIPVSIMVLIMVLLIKDNRPVLAVEQPIQRIVLILSTIAILVIPSIMLIVYFFRRKSLKPGQGDG